jgi:hypothetical protein
MRLTVLLVMLAALLGSPVAAYSPMRDMLDVSQLARFRPVKRVGMFSSYDRTGLNDDGFSGAHSFLRKEGDGLVIAELKGAGAITRIWTPTPIAGPILFYIDGEKRPRINIPFDQLFSGTRQPFTGHLVGRGAGGYWSYVPIEFARSIKIVVRAPKLQFYQVNYALYGRGARPLSEIGSQVLSHGQTEPGRTIATEVELPPGQPVTLFETRSPGRITSLKLGPSQAFAGDARDIDVRMTWDDAAVPAVQVPVTELFGFSFGRPSARSLLLGTEGEWSYFKFPMPFSKGAKIELVSRRTGGTPLKIRSEVTINDRGRAADEAHLHAAWTREARTRRGTPFTMLDVAGRGHVAGFALQVQGAVPGDTGFFEGDEQVMIDGQLAIHGTGTEDMFNGGWYGLPGRWNDRASFPLNGALDYSRQIARTGGYRLLVSDAYSFNKSLKFTVEHGPEHNAADGDYAGTVFYYLDRAAGEPPMAADRPVTKARSFRIGTYPLAGVDTLIDASLTPGNRKTDTGDVSIVTFARSRGAKEAVFEDTWGPPLLTLRVEAPQTGRYAIHVDAMTGPNAAKLQLRDANFQPVGRPSDFYSAAIGRSGFVSIGELDLVEGSNVVILTMPERNPASSGAEVSIIDIEGRLVGSAISAPAPSGSVPTLRSH